MRGGRHSVVLDVGNPLPMPRNAMQPEQAQFQASAWIEAEELTAR
jgi:hypothetical protein